MFLIQKEIKFYQIFIGIIIVYVDLKIKIFSFIVFILNKTSNLILNIIGMFIWKILCWRKVILDE